MRFVILGMLLVQPLSLYDFVKAFESGVSLLYRASTGSIKRALDGLLADGLIDVASAEPGGRGRKAYAINEAGRTAFFEWMHAEPAGSDVEAAVLHRLFFLGMLPPRERVGVKERMVRLLEGHVRELESLAEQLADVEAPDGFGDFAASQRATLELGRASVRHMLEWVRAYDAE